MVTNSRMMCRDNAIDALATASIGTTNSTTFRTL